MATAASVVPSLPPFTWSGLLRRSIQLLLAVGIGGMCYQLAPPDFERITRLMMGWDGFVLSILLLSWLTIFRTSAADIQRTAIKLHPNRSWTVLLVVTFVGSTISWVAVVLLLRGLHDMPLEERIEHIAVSVVAVASTWCLLHTLFALHYAHTYFSHPGPSAGHSQASGLRFSGAEPTSYWDFAYFAFVVGMTAQTADVVITSLHMRRLVLFHSLMAYVFNTSIFALSINILSGLL